MAEKEAINHILVSFYSNHSPLPFGIHSARFAEEDIRTCLEHDKDVR